MFPLVFPFSTPSFPGKEQGWERALLAWLRDMETGENGFSELMSQADKKFYPLTFMKWQLGAKSAFSFLSSSFLVQCIRLC